MMLVCPSCNARYMVSEGSIGPEGRKVHCANCGHEWFQEGPAAPNEPEEEGLDQEVLEAFEGLMDGEEIGADDDEAEIDLSMLGHMDVGMEDEEAAPPPAVSEDDLSISGEAEEEISISGLAGQDAVDLAFEEDEAEEEEDISLQPQPASEETLEEEPIPEAVKPLPEERVRVSPVADIEAQAAAKEMSKKRFAGYGAAAGVFVCLIGLMLVLKGPIFSAFPASALLYNMFGMELELPAQGLVIEKLGAEFAEKNGVRVLEIKGRVINLKHEELNVPLILATLRNEDGTDIESWMIEPPYQALAGEQSFDFEASYPGLPETAYSLNLQFAPFIGKDDLAAHAAEKEKEETPAEEGGEHMAPEEHHEAPTSHDAAQDNAHGAAHH